MPNLSVNVVAANMKRMYRMAVVTEIEKMQGNRFRASLVLDPLTGLPHPAPQADASEGSEAGCNRTRRRAA